MTKPSICDFHSAAEEFCKLAGSSEPKSKNDLWRIRELLLQLIFHIPAVENHQHDVERDGGDLSDEAFAEAVKGFQAFPFAYYRMVFDPHDLAAKDEPVVGMLFDDLADIYRDLFRGLDQWESDHVDEACFDWSQSYSTHWGRHAVNALTAIETYRVDNHERIEQPGE